VRRFSIGLSTEYPIKRPNPVIGDNPLALSPDGRTLVYVSEWEGKTRLIARQLDQLEARPIPGSEYAWSPFFSPDGLWIGFHQRGNERPKLMKLPVEGGVPVPLADSQLPFGGSWGEDGDIMFGRSIGSGIWRVSADGGTAEMITTVDREAGAQCGARRFAPHHKYVKAGFAKSSSRSTLKKTTVGSGRKPLKSG
ncbi:MAG: PD40 domain-containing protein, partial [Proteobacteria bacterium]|nr:PD40 domain-containing protein [Pseudomonadota bacterium]